MARSFEEDNAKRSELFLEDAAILKEQHELKFTPIVLRMPRYEARFEGMKMTPEKWPKIASLTLPRNSDGKEVDSGDQERSNPEPKVTAQEYIRSVKRSIFEGEKMAPFKECEGKIRCARLWLSFVCRCR